MYRLATMHSVTDRQTYSRQYDANGRNERREHLQHSRIYWTTTESRDARRVRTSWTTFQRRTDPETQTPHRLTTHIDIYTCTCTIQAGPKSTAAFPQHMQHSIWSLGGSEPIDHSPLSAALWSTWSSSYLGAKGAEHIYYCNSFVYCKPTVLILAYILGPCRKFATEGCIVSPSNIVCVTL